MPDTPGLPPQTRLNASLHDTRDAASNNTASNGYWIHDDYGPKLYVPPADAEPEAAADRERTGQIVAALAEMQVERLIVRIDDGVVVLSGVVASDPERRLVAEAAQTAAGTLRVSNRLTLKDAWQRTPGLADPTPTDAI